MIYTPDISAEYPGAAMRRLNAHFHSEGALFLQGAGGDSKPRQIAVAEERWRAACWEEMEEAGAEVAATVIAEVEHGLAPVSADLHAALVTAALPLPPPPPRFFFAEVLGDPRANLQRRSWAEEMLQRLDAGALPTTVDVAVHGLQLSPCSTAGRRGG